jgi:ribosomal protein L44E
MPILPSSQVNIPKTRNTFCKKCKKHTPQKVAQYKAGKASLFAQGTPFYRLARPFLDPCSCNAAM